MCSYHDHHTISLSLDKQVEARWTKNGKYLPQPHPLKASCALLFGRIMETHTTTFAVVEQLVPPPRNDCLKKVVPPQLETWAISECPRSLLIDAAKEKRREPLSGTEVQTAVFIRWHSQPSAGTTSLPFTFNTMIFIDCSISPIEISMEYSRGSLTMNQAWAQLTSLVHILEQVILSPELSLKELDFLGSHSTRLIRQWNDPYALARPGICIHNLILGHCHSRPDADAVCAWDGSVTYAELDQFSRALGLCLVSLGVGPESVVPLCFEKSRWTVIAMLGVLRAGGAFVLLDPSHPVARLGEICSEVQAEVLIVSDTLQELGSQLGPQVITVLDTIHNHVHTSTATLSAPVKPTNAAYVAFTSGSTGKPKGIVIEHQCFSANTLAQNAVHNLNQNTRVFQFASYGFDSSILETLMALVAGGCVCIPSEQQRLNGVADAIRELRANWLELTPSVARFINPEEVPDVRSVLLVGEPMSQDHITQWSSGNVQLLNAYGPAECSVVTTVQPHVQLHDPQNIGRSYSSHSWIVNPQDHDQLEPLGAVGELVISGPIVARGYLNQPHQTSFISNPRWATRFGIPPTERFYKTGDLVRYNLDDGTLRYVGRKDREVKIHGQRVNLQEIEHHASQFQKGMLAAADVVHVNGSTAGKLLALFIAVADADEVIYSSQRSLVLPWDDALRALVAGLQDWLRNSLPSYMVPTKYIFIDRFPLTRTGKLDRRALVDLGVSTHSPSLSSGQDPSNRRDKEDATLSPELVAKENSLRAVFSEVLGCLETDISAEDGFYDIGGNSLAAIEVVARTRKRGLELTVADVIRLQNPRKIAQRTSESRGVREILPFSLLNNTEQSLSSAAAQCGVQRGMIEDMYPCTPLQEGLMHLSTKTPGAFMGSYRFLSAPSANLDQIRDAWEQLWMAHPILRTRIIQLGSQMFQVVTKPMLSCVEISSMGDCQLMALGTPLAYVTFHHEETSHGAGIFRLVMHHAIFDGWSYLQLLEDLQLIYDGTALLPRPCFNHVIEYISKMNPEEGRSFWGQEFTDLQATSFPASSRRSSASPQWLFRNKKITLAESDVKWTLASKIKLAWALVISSQTNSSDVVYGLTVSGRNAPVPGIERIAGPTFATLPFRTQLDTKISVEEMLLQLRQHDISIMPFEHTGLKCIAESSSEAALACGFRNLLTIRLQSLQSPCGILIDLPEEEDQELNFASYPLSILVQQRGTLLEVKAIFNGFILGPSKVEGLLEQFDMLLQQILQEPEALIGNLRSKISPEWQQLAAINRKSSTHPVCLHDVIQKFSITQPDSEAVCAWDGSLTYEQLVTLSRRMAVHLKSLGSGPGTVIGICVERSKWFPVSILGALMSGAAMVLLEPNFPLQRLQHILRDAGARMVICSLVYQERCTRIVDEVVALTPDIMTVANDSAWAPSPVTPQDPMYVAFTSGSTGAPKGVVIEHGMVSSMLQAHKDIIGASSASRGLLFASPAFDICLAEIVLILGAGGCICVPSEGQRMNNLAKTMTTMQVNIAMLTPSVARTLSPTAVPCLRTLVLGGEAPSASDLATWALRVRLHQSYGPAECAMYTTTTGPLAANSDLGNVGFSPNASCWIVNPDNHDELLPLGSVGELLIGGPIVGRGYIKRPQETAVAFIRDPIWGEEFPSLRGQLYKTGDLATLNADGSLNLIGRKDTQVKLNGQRIELREIEHCAENYQHGTVVIAELIKTRGTQRHRLVMFVYDPKTVETTVSITSTPSDDQQFFLPPSTRNQSYLEGVKHHLNQHLPPYMVPSFFLALSRLPLSPSGKADRKTLRQTASDLDQESLDIYLNNSTREKREPITEQERFVRSNFATALSLNEDAIGVDDSFFALGGDSITAMRVLTLCRRRNMTISMQDFLSHNTVSSFCTHVIDIHGQPVDAKRQKIIPSQGKITDGDDVVQFERIGYELERVRSRLNLLASDSIEDIYPCSEAHSGILELYTPDYTSTAIFEIQSNRSVTAMQLSDAWGRLVQRHMALRTVLLNEPNIHSGYLQVVLDKGPTQPIILPPSKNALSDLKRLEPLPSWGLSPPHRLIIGQDHSGAVFMRLETGCALIDAFSMSILLEELSVLLQGRSLPEPGITYRQYLSHLRGQPTATTTQYWKQALCGAEPSHLPKLPAKQALQIGSPLPEPRSQTRCLPIAQARRLDSFWRSNNITITNLFQLSWALTLAHYTKSRDVCFGAITSGRDTPQLEVWNIVGSLFNILPCRILLDPNRTILDLLRHNQMEIQHRNDQQNCSMPDIIQRSGIKSSEKNQPLFNTVLTVQNPFSAQSSAKDGVNEIEIKLVELEDATEYDFCVAIFPSPSEFQVELRYSSSTASEEYASDILDCLFTQLDQIVHHATMPLNDITTTT
ncbi:hypothetical protein N7457_001853 [Penicillium paradoxum]|uniref:uncharacterized protein n=1 Tax=Penicillium paradoxum TaxID=176176 RepID=UPI0025472DCD|nr:uncharacterized protein N7457_001853 [Penicillium paradoxum]KAJ5795254.1 hypothetical protein N7457_001853 [Penicillium paradoxum]